MLVPGPSCRVVPSRPTAGFDSQGRSYIEVVLGSCRLMTSQPWLLATSMADCDRGCVAAASTVSGPRAMGALPPSKHTEIETLGDWVGPPTAG